MKYGARARWACEKRNIVFIPKLATFVLDPGVLFCCHPHWMTLVIGFATVG
jgi:hypothetical protein